MNQKIRVAILFGGRSAEHEVSLQSARNVYNAIDKNKYDVILIGIDHDGRWHLNDAKQFLLHEDKPGEISLKNGTGNLALVPGEEAHTVVNVGDSRPVAAIDVVFPVLHGPYGEDGTVQGLLKLADIPFVGSGVLGSAVGMDKDVMKRLFDQAGLPQARFLSYNYSQKSDLDFDKVVQSLGLPLFVKPANMGSSVGIGKIHNRDEFSVLIDRAFEYDNKIVLEENILAREIECSVLGNDHPRASVPGEVVASHEFYDYDAKYLDQAGARLEIPAKLNKKTTENVQSIAIKAFKSLCCSGMARVDFFLKKDGTILINEVNTIPGFTRISMYPKLWEFSGVSYSELIDRLIELALEKHRAEKRLKYALSNHP